MSLSTALDLAHAAVSRNPEDDTLRLRFYERLADGQMFLLLDKEMSGQDVVPRVFDLEDGPVVLVFDTEDRLASFSGGVVPYVALPGRVVANNLKGQGIGLGVNLGVAPSSMLLPPEALDWLAMALDTQPDEVQARPLAFFAPTGLPEKLITALDEKLARAAGLARAALIARVDYEGGRKGHMLAFLDALPEAETALARAAAEALVFSGVEAGEMDVAFLSATSPVALSMLNVALRFDLPVAEAAPAPTTLSPDQRPAPGSDPARPPRLR